MRNGVGKFFKNFFNFSMRLIVFVRQFNFMYNVEQFEKLWYEIKDDECVEILQPILQLHGDKLLCHAL